MRHDNLLGQARRRLRRLDAQHREKRRRKNPRVLLSDSKGIQRRLILVRRGDFGWFSGRVMIGHVEMHDGVVLVTGFFVRACFVVAAVFGVCGVQMKERRGKEPQQNRQAHLRRQGSPHGSYC
jgi:hypothetical protein